MAEETRLNPRLRETEGSRGVRPGSVWKARVRSNGSEAVKNFPALTQHVQVGQREINESIKKTRIDRRTAVVVCENSWKGEEQSGREQVSHDAEGCWVRAVGCGQGFFLFGTI